MSEGRSTPARAGAVAARSPLRGNVTVHRSPDLPQNSVRAIFQDHRRYLWFGTEEGVVRFDGKEWKHFRIADGLTYGFVQAIVEDRNGCVWVGTRIGLSRFDPIHPRRGAWRSFTLADGLPHVDVRAICADPDGMLWLGTRGGLARLDPGSLEIAPAIASSHIRALLPGQDGHLWAGSNEGVTRFDPRSGSSRNWVLPSSDVTSLAQDRSGALWVGTHDRGLVRLDPASGAVSTIDTSDGLPDDRVLTLLSDETGDLWVGTETAGIACIRDPGGTSRIDALSVDDGVADFMTLAMLEDRSGRYWFGSLAGLTCFEPEGMLHGKAWTSLTREDGLVHNLVVSVTEDSSGRFWFGTYGRGASVMTGVDGGLAWETFDASRGLSSGIVRAIAEDVRGRIWFGTFGGGLSVFDPVIGILRTFTTADGLAGDLVRLIRPDENGMFWVGTDGGGISLFDSADDTPAFRTIGVRDGLPSARISSIVHGAAGRVVVGTYDGGAAILESETWTLLGKDSGLPAIDIYCIAEDPAGRLWFGTGGSGLASFDGAAWRVYTEHDGLPNETIYQILVESERSVYASTNRGVFRLRLEDDKPRVLAFDRSDGLADDECNGGASLIDRAGRFWIGTLGGVSFIHPRDVPERIESCPVFITAFTVRDKPMDLDAVPEIEDSEHEFTFQYGAVEYASPGKVRYRTRLEGFDRDWSQSTVERHIRYTNLRPGRYRFLVEARNWGGEWSAPAEISFDVVPDRERLAREETIERERIERKVLETAHARLQQLAEELRISNAKLREKEVLLELQAREDPLTGLLNRRNLDHQIQQELQRASRFHRPFSVAMVDLDHFKSINDRFSHAIGDEVLRVAARVMRTSLRSVDTVARYGGEEFVFLLPETAAPAAAHLCEKIRAAIADYPWHDLHPDLRVTASFGVSDQSASSSAEILHAADQKLFQAKREGRNRVCC